MGTPSAFLVLVTGQLETAYFPDISNIYCKQSFVYGVDWTVVSGLEEGLSSVSNCSTDPKNYGRIVLNYPLDITFRATSPFGWPQLVLSCYGTDGFGNDVVRGYGAVHVPTVPGCHQRQVAMFVPESSSSTQKFLAWITGKSPEFVDSRIVAHGEGREVTRVRTQGHVSVSFKIIHKDLKKLGYDVSSQSMHQMSDFPIQSFVSGPEPEMPKLNSTKQEAGSSSLDRSQSGTVLSPFSDKLETLQEEQK